ncbi:hypothetical protein GCM10010371_21160 [Streptomyces subrutilus]|uniref:Uncharacterized protein n=1 Tax=Streptomyces subrutilus TaxID=36818 RepID=A0A918QR98_9ACTN|nr:hypothetical protein GCM10010371_21160 [Streptomyces subrutilus]
MPRVRLKAVDRRCTGEGRGMEERHGGVLIGRDRGTTGTEPRESRTERRAGAGGAGAGR